MAGNSYLRGRARRWTSSDVVAATMRLEKAFTADKISRAVASMHKATAARGHNLLPVERNEVEAITEASPVPVVLQRPRDNRPFAGFYFRLPWAPSVNNAYYNKNAGRGKSKKSRVFAEACCFALMEQKVPCQGLGHPMAIHITQHASRDAGDLDNYIKLVIDSLKEFGVIYDDNRSIVKDVHIVDGTRVKAGNEYIEVRIACVL
jgi:Holliday junction resolvase RusA-like endonuclease